MQKSFILPVFIFVVQIILSTNNAEGYRDYAYQRPKSLVRNGICYSGFFPVPCSGPEESDKCVGFEAGHVVDRVKEIYNACIRNVAYTPKDEWDAEERDFLKCNAQNEGSQAEINYMVLYIQKCFRLVANSHWSRKSWEQSIEQEKSGPIYRDVLCLKTNSTQIKVMAQCSSPAHTFSDDVVNCLSVFQQIAQRIDQIHKNCKAAGDLKDNYNSSELFDCYIKNGATQLELTYAGRSMKRCNDLVETLPEGKKIVAKQYIKAIFDKME